MTPTIRIEYVCAFSGQNPEVIGRRRNGQPIVSAIRKEPVAGPTVDIMSLGLVGDLQAESSTHDDGKPRHGGSEMAVYVYPVVHYRKLWEPTGLLVPGRRLGENLGITGISENEVNIGDVWSWGPAELVITKPRIPCFKLDRYHQPGTMEWMVITGASGWYMSVRRPGVVPTRGTIQLLEVGDGPTIAQKWEERAQRGKALSAPE
jgi:MOSC domain-containing protein YiiM